MARISNTVVTFYPTTGEVVRENPLPKRAVETRARDPKSAAYACGLGRIKWSMVEGYTKRDIADFKKRYQLGNPLAKNAKTVKPRPSGRHGEIRGLNLSPHYYANLLEKIDVVGDSTILRSFDRRWFNAFDGGTPKEAAAYSERLVSDLLNFCVGSSQWCRQTCLVLTGQHPSTLEASRAKMKFTFAALSEPELFVAFLHGQLESFGRSARRRGYDAVVRLNMLSDVPWYIACPELLLAHDGAVTFYDYTKLPFWRSPEYRRLPEGMLDLTFSFSGSNDSLCEEALKAGYRVATVFAPADAQRSASVAYRTSWRETLESGLVDDQQRIALFGGKWPIVDGDESDYRIDDPAPSIVALNFKNPTAKTERLEQVLPESRAHFAVQVPDPYGKGERAAAARARRAKWSGVDASTLPLDAQIAFGEDDGEPYEYEDDAPVVDNDVIPEGVGLAMAPIVGTELLIGPHVPTMLND